MTNRILATATLLMLIGVAFAQEPKQPAEPVASAKPAGVSQAEAKVAEQLYQDARKLYFQGKHLEAIERLEKAVKTNGTKTGYQLLLAKAYRTVKQDAKATAMLENLLKSNADHVEAGLELAELLTPQKKPDRVIAILKPLLKLKHVYPLYHLLGEAYYEKEDFNESRKHFEEAIKLNAQNRDDHYQLGNIYLAQKRFAKSAASYERASLLGMSSGVFHFKLASVYFNLHNYLGNITTAEVIGGKAGQISNNLYLLESVPGKKDTFYVTGPQSAVFQVAKAQELGIDIFEIRFLEANVWLSSHEFEKADAVYKALQEVVPKENLGLFWSQWAETALGLDEFDNYVARLKKAIEADPDVYKATLSDAYVTVANRHHQRGDNDQYIAFLNKSVDLNPLSARLHLTLGDALWDISKKPQAIQQYKLVLELEPEFAQRVRLLNRIRGRAETAPIKVSARDPRDVPVVGVKCLMSAEPAIARFTMNFKGGKLYFCCAGCRSEFTDNLTANSALANHQMLLTGQVRGTICLFTGRKLNPRFTIKVAGADVPLCCNGCKTKALAVKGDAQMQLLFNNAAFAKGFELVARPGR